MTEKIFVLADDYSDSANKLARYLHCEVSSSVMDISHKVKYLVRYGLTTPLGLSREPIEINAKYAIANTSNKYHALQQMSNYGICVPQFTKREFPSKWVGLPYMARTFYHSQGRGLRIVDSLYKPLSTDEYAIEIIDVDKEYRVFVYKRKCIGVDRKIDNGRTTDNLVRNHRNGWDFISLSKERNPVTYRKVGGLGVSAVRVFELDFGAVDILKGTNEKLYVLEINTAPGLRVGKAKRLANYIRMDFNL
jgi:hypothetical protein